jgi:hypothetical protein
VLIAATFNSALYVNFNSASTIINKVRIIYPIRNAMTNVIAGTRLPIALAIDDEAKYSPSAKTF